MRRHRRSPEELQGLRQQAEESRLRKAQQRQAYNKVYRKSFFFISAWVCRIFYFIAFFVIALVHEKPATRGTETVLESRSETYHTRGRRMSSGHTETELYVRTAQGRYSVVFQSPASPELQAGELITVDRNRFGKAIWLGKAGWPAKYGITTHFIVYYSVFFLSFLSFFFNDGFDRFSKKLLAVICIADIATVLAYFFL